MTSLQVLSHGQQEGIVMTALALSVFLGLASTPPRPDAQRQPVAGGLAVKLGGFATTDWRSLTRDNVKEWWADEVQPSAWRDGDEVVGLTSQCREAATCSVILHFDRNASGDYLLNAVYVHAEVRSLGRARRLLQSLVSAIPRPVDAEPAFTAILGGYRDSEMQDKVDVTWHSASPYEVDETLYAYVAKGKADSAYVVQVNWDRDEPSPPTDEGGPPCQ
jgi:hypothetical protein